MTVKELIEMLKTVDPDMEVIVSAPDSGYYTDEYIEYSVDERAVGEEYGKFYICVDNEDKL